MYRPGCDGLIVGYWCLGHNWERKEIVNNLKYRIKELSAGKNVEEHLPVYIEQCTRNYHNFAQLKLMMEYYTFYEVYVEGINPYVKEADETIRLINEVIQAVYVDETAGDSVKDWIAKVDDARKQVMEKMQVATSYIDALILFEYILNRIQYKFEPMEEKIQEEAFAGELVQKIFGVQDNVVINENIRGVLGQLPVRMTKKKYFDLVKDSLSVYKESEQSSLDNYLYMFRTSAGIYTPKGMEEHFVEFKGMLEELSSLDYASLTKEAYEIYAKKIVQASDKLRDISDVYMSLQQMINDVYTVLLNLDYKKHESDSDTSKMAIKEICMAFLDDDKEVSLEQMEEYLVRMEGSQEEYYEKNCLLEAVLDEVVEGNVKLAETLGLAEKLENLQKSAVLMSPSIFIEFDQEADGKMVTEQYLKEQTDTLIAELEAVFKEKGKYLRRAMMAATLEKMPVFFTSPQEVSDYIQNALLTCTDESEKYAAMLLIREMMW